MILYPKRFLWLPIFFSESSPIRKNLEPSQKMLRLIGYSTRPLRLPLGGRVFSITKKLFPCSRKSGNRLFHRSTDLPQPLCGNLLDRHRIHQKPVHDRR